MLTSSFHHDTFYETRRISCSIGSVWFVKSQKFVSLQGPHQYLLLIDDIFSMALLHHYPALPFSVRSLTSMCKLEIYTMKICALLYAPISPPLIPTFPVPVSYPMIPIHRCPFLQPYPQPSSQVTLVTQCSYDRLEAVLQQALRWGGDVSLAVLIPSAPAMTMARAMEAVETLCSQIDRAWKSRPSLSALSMDIALLDGVEADISRHDSCGPLYPVNTLRNLALIQVNHVLFVAFIYLFLVINDSAGVLLLSSNSSCNTSSLPVIATALPISYAAAPVQRRLHQSCILMFNLQVISH